MNELTPSALEGAAKALAEAVNGGVWEVDYTKAQQQLWRDRVKAVMSLPLTEPPA